MNHEQIELNLVLAVASAMALVFGLFSAWVRRSWISGPSVAIVVGFLLGPTGFGWVTSPRFAAHEALMLTTAEVTLALGVMAAALRIPPGFLRRHAGSVGLLLVVGMVGMWLVSAGFVWLIIGVSWTAAMLVGAVLTPTDPVLAGSIVTGPVAEENVGQPLRHVLTAESGINDGLAYPIVVIAMLLGQGSDDADWQQVLTETILWHVVGAVLLGLAAGSLTGWCVEWACAKHSIETTSFLIVSLALTAAVVAGAKLLDVNSILAVFVSGQSMAHTVTRSERLREYQIQEAVTRVFILPGFLLFGVALPVAGWLELGWRGVALVAGILVLRRLPILLGLKKMTPALHDWRDAMFVGWFGPIGIAALFYACSAAQQTGNEQIWTVASLVILASTVIHGVSAVPLTQLYGSTNAHRATQQPVQNG